MKINKIIAVSVASTTALVGCDTSEPKTQVKYVYLEPTEAQIQAAVDKTLAAMNKEKEEISTLVSELKKGDNSVVDARYDLDNQGNKTIVVTHKDPDTNQYNSYAVPIAVGALAGLTTYQIAKLLNNTSRDYYSKCDYRNPNRSFGDCENPYYSIFRSDPYYGGNSYYSRGSFYDDYDSYHRDSVRQSSRYRSVMTSPSPSKTLSDKQKLNSFNSSTKNGQVGVSSSVSGKSVSSINTTGTSGFKSGTAKADTSKANSKASLSTKTPVLNSSKSSSRSSSMSFSFGG